ncbi:MAG: CRISPR-associated endoribonuclease Cas6, partial [Firmicutes bacterium]|nr:CRISPR-associated endoribonuclease Cas6 [Bacillota bacterium]
YEILRRGDAGYADFLHGEGYADPATGRRYKPFTFLPLRARGGRADFVVSSPLPEFDRAFLAGLESAGALEYLGRPLTVLRVELLPRPALGEFAVLRALAPVVATRSSLTEGKRYYRGPEPEFGALVRANLLAKYRACAGREPGPLDLAVVEGRPGGCRYLGRFIVGGRVQAVLAGDPDLVRFAYYCGLGEKNSMGFGMAAAA